AHQQRAQTEPPTPTSRPLAVPHHLRVGGQPPQGAPDGQARTPRLQDRAGEALQVRRGDRRGAGPERPHRRGREERQLPGEPLGPGAGRL
ncbi:MAG: hypothetical protein AVDCRST_MAG68-5086, partial [uncultured Gemmatimonadetes bacterium]